MINFQLYFIGISKNAQKYWMFAVFSISIMATRQTNGTWWQLTKSFLGLASNLKSSIYIQHKSNQLVKILQTNCFTTFGSSPCQGSLWWHVQFFNHGPLYQFFCVIIACNYLPFFKIFSSFVRFCQIFKYLVLFQHFFALFLKNCTHALAIFRIALVDPPTQMPKKHINKRSHVKRSKQVKNKLKIKLL